MKKFIYGSIAVFYLLLPFACSKDPLSSLDGIYVPQFTNFWAMEKGPGDFIVLNAVVESIDSSKGTGLLTGDHQDGMLISKMKGSFENLKVNMQFLTNAENGTDNGPNQGKSYKGRYDTLSNPFRIRMASVNNSSDSFVIRLN